VIRATIILAAVAALFMTSAADAKRRAKAPRAKAERVYRWRGSAAGFTSRGREAAHYANCSAARAAGAAPVRVGDPGYSRKLDRDGDGVGCE
jgi:hypothetical protein